ncbi:Holliday junction resolvase-like protein [Treponema phagedenis]|uniref:Holliday junction resolvase-like protein n=1 Tax=Treponema phagedenis TaxID=162 RepID=UPI0002D6AF6F|nr:Holliday junction resolvase-like protein [Treponema phagedenis]TYT79260.1 hypothetical protein FS559_09235 [Treponema phagedenis]
MISITEMSFLYFILGSLSAAFLIFFIGLSMGKLTARKEIQRLLKEAREDAVKRSRAVLGGQFSEQIAPFLPGFPADPTEIRFIGKPIDFIAFVGNSMEDISEVLFIEVKSGKSELSKTEKSLKRAIESGFVRWVEYRVPPY